MIIVPDSDLLTRAVRTFLNTDPGPDYLKTPGTLVFVATTGARNTSARDLYTSLGGGLATQGATENYWFRL